ncbi:hypothetical protein [Azospirillum rugosum]|uniref:5-methylcytosine-specific restriction endonuclease McrA n=1 Tax=Azospirillum rugosum TaxID=416170 RepID=A0ABS4SRW5_9PROT|nr:hypothetical protein [Azospirillum rugosum]MBP2295305.1 5-methylcytosine-specific restriction endonuclease McrA [Azospirillum rugosum]MDQ0528680.1 5-methylcytosine-specific restriction endonuclease McrA [Azospirillum rugosum]
MLKLPAGALDPLTKAHIEDLQRQVDSLARYPQRVAAAKRLWAAKTNTPAGKAAFLAIRTELKRMCFGAVRCGYCSDSMADEIEHILPKSFFPQHAFDWDNHLFACGPCNGGEKRDQYAYLDRRGVLKEVVRKRGAAVRAPGKGVHALINPRTEDPRHFLELDLMSRLPNGTYDVGSLHILPRLDLSAREWTRADYTVRTLGLNRDPLPRARRTAFRNYKARLREYVEDKATGKAQADLDTMRDGILDMDHPLVFVEMQRQQSLLPPLKALFDAAPEALSWTFGPRAPIVP